MKKILLSIITFLLVVNILSPVSATQENQNTVSFDKLLTKNDEVNAIIYFEAAKIYSAKKDHENAVNYYTKAIELNPKLVPAYIGRAKDCGDMGDYKCSLENYEALKSMYPNEHFFYHMSSLYKTNTKDLDGAMEDIDKAISMVKKPESMYYAQKAWVYLEKKDYDNAKDYLKKSLKINPNDGYALGLLMIMAVDNENYDTVIRIVRHMLKVDPAAKYNPAMYATYAKALYKTGKRKEAIKQINTSLQLEPHDKENIKLKEKMLNGESID